MTRQPEDGTDEARSTGPRKGDFIAPPERGQGRNGRQANRFNAQPRRPPAVCPATPPPPSRSAATPPLAVEEAGTLRVFLGVLGANGLGAGLHIFRLGVATGLA